MMYDSDVSIERRILARALEPIRKHTAMDMVLGGPVRSGASSMEITDFTGVRTRSTMGLVVRNGQGLGGKALMLGRPAAVADYISSPGITHVYDNAVRPEAIETLAALPIMVERTPRILLYLGSRTHVHLGDRWFDSFTPIIRRIERDILVEDEICRRLAVVRTDAQAERSILTQAELRDIAAELADLAGQIEDTVVRTRIESVSDRLTPLPSAAMAPDTIMRPREIDVLEQVARGLSNREISKVLGLRPDTVKSYLKTAMRKLHASNRVQAILTARERGLIA